jgi:molecular chaperone DnaJ
MAKDFYFILQVRKEASPDEIRSAYRRRAQQLHPDKSGSSSEPFIELQEAYSVLSDPAQRAAYDRGAESVPVRLGQPTSIHRRTAEPFRDIEQAGSFREASLSQSFDSFAPSFDELFERLWSNFDLLTRPKAERVEGLNVEVTLTPEEAEAGGCVQIQVPARAVCPSCRGHGALGLYECWRCLGQGTLTAEYPIQVNYPSGLRGDHIVRVPLDEPGIHNFYLTVRFRPSEA